MYHIQGKFCMEKVHRKIVAVNVNDRKYFQCLIIVAIIVTSRKYFQCLIIVAIIVTSVQKCAH